MNPASREPQHWSRQQWLILIGLVFAAQIGIIFTLGEREEIAPRGRSVSPKVMLGSGADRKLASLEDPTLLALPHPRGFSAGAWLRGDPLTIPPFRWTEPPRWMKLPTETLGQNFRAFMLTNTFVPFALEIKAAPEALQPDLPAPEYRMPTQSNLRVAGDLAQRPLLQPVKLASWPSADLVTNTVVEVLVDADGHVFRRAVLAPLGTASPPGSTQSTANQSALDETYRLRFKPLAPEETRFEGAASRLTRGYLIFEWFTEPLPTTNGVVPP